MVSIFKSSKYVPVPDMQYINMSKRTWMCESPNQLMSGDDGKEFKKHVKCNPSTAAAQGSSTTAVLTGLNGGSPLSKRKKLNKIKTRRIKRKTKRTKLTKVTKRTRKWRS